MGERFFGWISYACSQSERLGPPTNDWSPYQYDQTNIATVVASYKMTPAWGLGLKLHYNTGPLLQSFQYRFLDSGGIWRAKFSDTYDQRLDDYMRLDLRTDYGWRFPQWRLNIYIEALNVLNRANPAGLNYPRDYDAPPDIINNLPIFPYLGVQAEF